MDCCLFCIKEAERKYGYLVADTTSTGFSMAAAAFFYAAAAKSLQSCSTLCDPIDCSPPGSAVPGILQAEILEWVAISFSGNLPIH